jgi:hypothetical protein
MDHFFPKWGGGMQVVELPCLLRSQFAAEARMVLSFCLKRRLPRIGGMGGPLLVALVV